MRVNADRFSIENDEIWSNKQNAAMLNQKF